MKLGNEWILAQYLLLSKYNTCHFPTGQDDQEQGPQEFLPCSETTCGTFLWWIITLSPAVLDPSYDSSLFSMENSFERPLHCPENRDLGLTFFMPYTTWEHFCGLKENMESIFCYQLPSILSTTCRIRNFLVCFTKKAVRFSLLSKFTLHISHTF